MLIFATSTWDLLPNSVCESTMTGLWKYDLEILTKSRLEAFNCRDIAGLHAKGKRIFIC